MRFFTVAAATLALASSVLAIPTILKPVSKFNGPVNSGSFIVKLKDGASMSALNGFAPSLSASSEITHSNWDEKFFNGFAAKLDEHSLNNLRAHPDVEFIEEDGIMHTMAISTQTDAPWGIARISQNGKLSNQNANANTFTYKFDSRAGSGVDIYIVDTGINAAHTDFGGRATFAAVFGGFAAVDGNGHGTHCAGTAAGTRWGVAKSAKVFGVKVLSDQGSGSVSDIISGLNFVLSAARSSGRPTIASMSLGGGASTSLDNAVASLTSGGVHVTVAAGNDGANAANTSPARAPTANTIGATSIGDAIASFSNFGSVVDLFAPGVTITSAWMGSTTATETISGTSMATPHVAGLIAYLISTGGNLSPADMSNKLKSLSVKGVITGIPSGTLNDFARNDVA